jgi:hypothetical protein
VAPRSVPGRLPDESSAPKIDFLHENGAKDRPCTVSGLSGKPFFHLLRENGSQKVAFCKSKKSKMVQKSNFSVKIGTGTLYKGGLGAVLKKHGKNNGIFIRKREILMA